MWERRAGEGTGWRWSFVVAGIGALAVALARGILGSSADLPHMTAGLDRPEFGSLIVINWHALTAAFAILGLGLLFGARSTRPAARAIGWIAAAIFGSTCAIFMAVNASAFGSPFHNWPFLPLGIETLLAAFAAWRAR